MRRRADTGILHGLIAAGGFGLVVGAMACGGASASAGSSAAPAPGGGRGSAAAKPSPPGAPSPSPSSFTAPPAASSPRPTDPTLDLLDTLARFVPEQIGGLGLPGHEEDVADFQPDVARRTERALREAKERVEAAEAKETDPAKRTDLLLTARAADRFAHEQQIEETRYLPHSDIGKTLFIGLTTHLRPGGDAAHALARLRKYAGAEPGTTPIATLARARTEERLTAPGLLFPFKTKVEQQLADLPTYLKEIDALFKKRGVQGYEAPMAALRTQMEGYAAFVRAQVLPRARTDFKLPPDVYDFELHDVTGVDIPRGELEARAHAAYAKTKKEMDVLAKAVAKEKKLRAKGFRDVLAELRKDQVPSGALIALYRKRDQQIEDIIRREKLVTLPQRPVRYRLATPAETAENPSPTIDQQALFKKGAPIDFLLPVAPPPRPGEAPGSMAYEDFTFDAASWGLAAHEMRPGHELQFSRMKESGVSLARTLFAFNAVNVEGWGLYSETLIFPFMPKEGQLADLRFRALREARAFLDPELHEGKITLDQAKALLHDELGFTDGVVRMETDRYTFGSPTQATAYFYGAEELARLRRDTEKAMGARFDARAFHDFILDEGLVTPDLLRDAVMTRFVNQATGATPGARSGPAAAPAAAPVPPSKPSN